MFAGDVVDLGDGRSLDGVTRQFTLKKGDTVSQAFVPLPLASSTRHYSSSSSSSWKMRSVFPVRA